MARVEMAPVRAMLAGSAVLAAVALAGCATSPVPNEKMAVAQASVQRAEQAGADQAAPVPLSNAKQELLQAKAEAAASHGIAAGDLADKANVDAQLAEATATQQKSHQAAVEFDASMQALRQESQRATSTP